jgi:hypothetical protein
MREIRYIVISLLTLLTVSSVEASRDHDGTPLLPQEQSQFVISARAGSVNLVEGDLSLKRADAQWKSLAPTDEIQAGDLVRTGHQGRAEILLYPGAFLRVAEDTQFSFVDISVDHLRIRIDAGSAIIEAPSVEKFKGTLATVLIPRGELSMIRAGIYRFDVDPSGKTTAEVFKGRLSQGSTEIKEGQRATMDGGTTAVSAFDRKTLDAFDEWSKDRSKALAQVNAALRNTTLPTAGSGLLGSDPCGGFWYFYGPLGSPQYYTLGARGVYTYVPFGSCSPWFSPYGWEYLPWNYAPGDRGPTVGHHHKHHKPHGPGDHGSTLATAKPGNKSTVAPGTGGANAATGAGGTRPGKIIITDKSSPTSTPASSTPVSRTPAASGSAGASGATHAASRSSSGSSAN